MARLDLAALKAALDITAGDDDNALNLILAAAKQEVDTYLKGSWFKPVTGETTKTYAQDKYLPHDDVTAVTSVEDSAGDDVEYTWDRATNQVSLKTLPDNLAEQGVTITYDYGTAVDQTPADIYQATLGYAAAMWDYQKNLPTTARKTVSESIGDYTIQYALETANRNPLAELRRLLDSHRLVTL